MILSDYIHTRWENDTTLNGLLDIAYFVTGTHFREDPGSTYATLTFPGGDRLAWTNNGAQIVRELARITVHHDNYDTGRQIMNAVMSAFDQAEFNLSSSDEVINMKLNTTPTQIQDEETGEWDFVIDFDCIVDLADGV